MGFQQGLSGLNASSSSLDVIGNNIANANTYGEKSSRAEFGDLYAGALNGSGSSPIGIGVTLQTVAQQFTQGNITTTDNSMDLAINGGGFFQVSDGSNPTEYTRNGQFKINNDGYIVNDAGLKLLGYPASSTGVIQPGQAQPLQLPTGGIDPKATTSIDMQFTLDSRAAVTASTTAPGSINLNDPTTYNNATSATVYDTKGQPVALTFYFQKNADASDGSTTWNIFATANGKPFTTDSFGNAIDVDSNGNPTAPYATITFPASGGSPIDPTAPLAMDVPAGTNSTGASTLEIPGINFNITGATENGSNFSVTNLTQDGYAPGQLSGINIDDTGTVLARYSNGQSKPAGQVELATFRNPQGLQSMGGNVWSSTNSSGSPIVGVPGSGNLGAIQSGALEDSNVDLTAELVNMITAQRTYQANAQTIKTEDQVLQTIVNLR